MSMCIRLNNKKIYIIGLIICVSLILNNNKTLIQKQNNKEFLVSELIEYSNFNELQKEGYNSENISITIIDTGVAYSSDIKNNILVFEDFINKKTNVYDDNGHGTEICGILFGTDMEINNGYFGIIPNAKLIMLKAFNEHGIGNLIAISESVNWIINNKDKYNIRIVLMSFGFDSNYENIVLHNLMDELLNDDIIIITSAGNNGMYGKMTLPGIYSKVISVGSINYIPNLEVDITNSNISDFSSREYKFTEKPDVYAPGEHIVTMSSDLKYTIVNGTSYSAAITCGQLALYLQQNTGKENKIIKNDFLNMCDEKIFFFKK